MSILKQFNIDESVANLTDQEKLLVAQRMERWDKALERGILVSLHIRQWRAVFALDVWSLARLGLVHPPEDRDLYKNALSFGRLHLLPKPTTNAIDRIESAARRTLEAHSHPLIFGHFVPEPTIVTLLDKLGGIQDAFFSFVDNEIIAQLDDLRRQMETTYRRIFANAYASLKRQGMAEDTDERQFVEESLNYVRSNYLSPEEVRDKYSFVRELRLVPFRDQLAEQEARAARLAQEAAQSQAALDDLTARTQERIDQELRTQAAQEMDRVLESIALAEEAMIEQMSVACEEVSEAITRNERIPSKSSVRLDNLIASMRDLRSAGLFVNQSLEESLDTLAGRLDIYRAASSRDKKVILPTLTAQIKRLGQDAATLVKPDQALSTGSRRRRFQLQ